ncbi:outer membrane beta-barrel family protein [Nemorincola caseinilytica]|uniref:Outer membrane beta-barrel family protein n=2 Tax=Nemorincola caseinilytica TaxID=2054315 RepID=A0ABP8NQQ6_9BACT
MLPALMCCAILLISIISVAQSVKVICKVADKNGVPISYAAIQVSSATDSANAHYEADTDSAGTSTFTLTSGEKYIVRTFSMGYRPAVKNILVKGTRPVFDIVLEPDTKTLGTVNVTYKRPLMRQEEDKTIVDPEELAASSTNAFDIIEKVPGLFVDQDGNIYISSSTPATVYINGREQKMGRAEVAAMLKSLPPGSIDRIEIMRTPSTRYDASSSGGIVNVILKKGVRIGLTGSVNAGMNQGTYGNQFAGVVINNSNGVLSTSFNIQASRRATGEQLNTDRTFAADSLLSQNAYTTYPGDSYYGSYSIGYTPNKKWDITYDGRGSLNHNNTNSSSPAHIEKISTGEQVLTYKTDVANRAANKNITQGLSGKYKIDTLGSEWSTDLTWSGTPTRSEQAYNTVYYTPFYDSLSGKGNIDNRYNYFAFQTDMVWKLPYKISLEGGVKASNVWFCGSTDYDRTYNDTTRPDPARTNAYTYEEHIYAGYLQATKTLQSILIKGGSRIENTNMLGHQTVPTDTGFRIRRTDLFPYLYISRKLMKIAGWELRSYLIYRRTITRPAYDYLNPFPRYVDQYLSEAGNPSLRPQFTKNYEANVSVDDRPIIAFGYNDMTDMFSQVVYQADSSRRQTLRTYDNLGTNKEFYMKGLGAIPPGKTYFFVLGGQYNYNFYEGFYNGQPLSYTRGSWTFFTYQTLKLGKYTQVVLNGFMRYKGQVQFYELSTFGALNLSVNRQFLQKKLKVTLSVNDMFFTNNNHFVIEQGNIYATGLRRGDTRRYGMNVMYNFGIRKKEEHNFLNAESPENSK